MCIYMYIYVYLCISMYIYTSVYESINTYMYIVCIYPTHACLILRRLRLRRRGLRRTPPAWSACRRG